MKDRSNDPSRHKQTALTVELHLAPTTWDAHVVMSVCVWIPQGQLTVQNVAQWYKHQNNVQLSWIDPVIFFLIKKFNQSCHFLLI